MAGPDTQVSGAGAAGNRRVCLVGAGFVAGAHAAALASIAGVEAVAICDPDAGRARSLADRWGIEATFASAAEAIAARGFDAAHVLAPPPAHATIAAQASNTAIMAIALPPS